MTRWFCFMTTLAVTFAWMATAAAIQIPGGTADLPTLVLEHLPASVRQAIGQPYRDARAQPGNAALLGRLAMLLHAHEQYPLAEAYYRRAAVRAPREARWPYLLGVVQGELGRTAEAIHSLRRVLALDPAHLNARLRLAEALMRNLELDASRAAYEALIRDVPELPAAHYGRGRVLTAQEDHLAAAASYRLALDRTPQFGAAHYALALAYRDAGLPDLASASMKEYQQRGASRPVPPDPDLDEVRALKSSARDLIVEAARLGDSGRLQEAVALHLKALAADPAAAQAHVNLIALYGQLGDRAKAEEHYRAAVRLGSSLADAHYNYGVLLASARLTTEALEAFRRALEVNPFHPRAHHNVASLLATGGRLEEAISHFQSALASDPGHRAARMSLARVLVGAGRPREAVPHLERLLRLARAEGELGLAAKIQEELARMPPGSK